MGMEDRNIFAEVEEVEQLVKRLDSRVDNLSVGFAALSPRFSLVLDKLELLDQSRAADTSQLNQKLDLVLANFGLVLDKLDQIITQLIPPVKPAKSLVLTLGQPVPQ